MIEKGSIIRNLNGPEDGVCIVLDVKDDRIEAYSGREEKTISLRKMVAQIEAVNCDDFPPSLLQKLQEALRQYDAEQEEIVLGKLLRQGNRDSKDNDNESAIRDYTEALELHPDGSSVRFARGGVFRRLLRWDDAEADFLTLKDGPQYRRQALILAAICRLFQNKPHGAIELLEEALRSDPAGRDALERAAEAHENAAEQHRERAREYRRRFE